MSNALASDKFRGEGRPRALADVQLNTILGEEGTSSASEDEAWKGVGIQSEDARTSIGISIGSEQTRLISPKTPAIEKQAAIEKEGGFFGTADGRSDSVPELLAEEDTADEDDVLNAPPQVLSPVQEDVPSGRQPRVAASDRSARLADVRMPSPWRARANDSHKSRSRSLIRW